MYCKIVAHKPSEKGTSSRNIFDYLDKENQNDREKDILAWEKGALSTEEMEAKFFEYDNLFNQDFDIKNLDDEKNHISVEMASRLIDENRGSRKNSEANFYMLNISPSQKELAHLDKMAEQILQERGLDKNMIENSNDPLLKDYYQDQKEQVLQAQLKSYAKDVMDEYARAMDREVYVYQDKLPDDKARKEMLPEIERRYEEYLKSAGLIKNDTSEKLVVGISDVRELSNGKNFTIVAQEQEMEMFVPNDKIYTHTQDTLILDKSYYDEKVSEINDREQGLIDDSKVKVFEASIQQEQEKSVLLSTRPENYNEEVRFWVNKKDIEIKDNTISMQEYKAEKLIEKAIERDKDQKEYIEIKYDRLEVSDIKVKEGEQPDKMYSFYRREQGLNDPIKFTFKESELKREGDTIFAKKYELDYRVNNAFENQVKTENSWVKEKIKDEVWRENGYDTTKRKMEGKDLLWFGKTEVSRSYTHRDKQVLENRVTFKKIEELKQAPEPNKTKIEKLEATLHRDKHTGEIIKEGVKKGGQQNHIHIVVSRHDRTNLNPKDKVSMSPLANHKSGLLPNGAKVGFNRDEFFKAQETIFDKKFGYNRTFEQTYQYNNLLKKEVKSQVENQVKGKLKQFIQEYSGIVQAKRELNPISNFRQQFKDIPLPTSFPKTKLQAVKQAITQIKKMVIDVGKEISY